MRAICKRRTSQEQARQRRQIAGQAPPPHTLKKHSLFPAVPRVVQYKGVQIDVLYASLAMHTLPEELDLSNHAVLRWEVLRGLGRGMRCCSAKYSRGLQWGTTPGGE